MNSDTIGTDGALSHYTEYNSNTNTIVRSRYAEYNTYTDTIEADRAVGLTSQNLSLILIH